MLRALWQSSTLSCPRWATDSRPRSLPRRAGRAASCLANFGVGYNHIDVDAARAAGVDVTNTPGAVTDATADIAMTLILMSARRASEGERMLRNGAIGRAGTPPRCWGCTPPGNASASPVWAGSVRQLRGAAILALAWTSPMWRGRLRSWTFRLIAPKA